MILGIALIGILFLTTCKTENTPTVSSGSWTFKSMTYSDTKGIPGTWHGALVSVLAQSSKTFYPSLTVSDSSTIAFTSGTYPVGGAIGSLNIEVVDSSGVAYIPMLNDTGTISVTAVDSKVSLSSAGIRMVNFGLNPVDTSILTFNITQTY